MPDMLYDFSAVTGDSVARETDAAMERADAIVIAWESTLRGDSLRGLPQIARARIVAQAAP